jgi:hypothetical protein
MKFIAGLCAAVLISAVGLAASAFADATADKQAPAPVEITYVGCLRAWKPATDVTKFPESKLGTYVLTPIAANITIVTDVPTYLLLPSQVVNFAAHLDDKVEVTGVPQSAPQPRTIGAIVGAPTPRPEERPTTDTMPRLTVKTLRKLSDACPS